MIGFKQLNGTTLIGSGTYKFKHISESEPPATPYLTFSSPSSFTLRTYNNAKNWDGTLEYSTNTTTWTTWTGTTLSSVGNKLYLRGIGNTKITGNSANYRWVLTGSNISCTGNIENLLDYQTVALGNHPTMASHCYYGMFSYCTSLITAPELPATTLADYCYYNMFYGCTSLTTTPSLPATTLAIGCYQYMFYGCTSLITAPQLPATTLAASCYNYMFYGCSALITAPQLPATTLADYCYSYMFYNCKSLTTPPTLPATTLASYCYQNMFYGCSALVTPPQLPATTLAIACYNGMFAGCSALTIVPQLPATRLASNCYGIMFFYCTTLKVSSTQTGTYQYVWRIPTIGTGGTATNWNNNMLNATGGTFSSNPSINTTYYVENEPI